MDKFVPIYERISCFILDYFNNNWYIDKRGIFKLLLYYFYGSLWI